MGDVDRPSSHLQGGDPPTLLSRLKNPCNRPVQLAAQLSELLLCIEPPADTDRSPKMVQQWLVATAQITDHLEEAVRLAKLLL